MSLSQAGNALNATAATAATAPFALNWRGLAGYQHNGSADQAASSLNDALKRQQMTSNFGDNSAQVSLSDAARALAAFENNASASAGNTSGAGSNGTTGSSGIAAPGSSDFGQEALYLGGITDASLVAMGIITPDQQAGTQITFNSLSYNVSSSASAGISQQNGQTVAAYGTEQQAEFVGQGQITTSDGRTFDFQVEVDLDQSQQIEAAGGTGAGAAGASQSSNDTAALAANATPPALPPTADNSSSSGASPTAASGDLINWDAILNQSKSLMNLLESIGKENQAAQVNGVANGAANGVANGVANRAASNSPDGAASSVAGASSGPASASAQNPATPAAPGA